MRGVWTTVQHTHRHTITFQTAEHVHQGTHGALKLHKGEMGREEFKLILFSGTRTVRNTTK